MLNSSDFNWATYNLSGLSHLKVLKIMGDVDKVKRKVADYQLLLLLFQRFFLILLDHDHTRTLFVAQNSFCRRGSDEKERWPRPL